jgi:hypothetical protein
MNHKAEYRKKSALERAEERAKLTDEQQLDRLDQMFGKNIGAKKERAKLLQRISMRKAKSKPATEQVEQVNSKSATEQKSPQAKQKGKNKNA